MKTSEHSMVDCCDNGDNCNPIDKVISNSECTDDFEKDHRFVKDSKKISRVLRHRPDVDHDELGWFSLQTLSKVTSLSESRILFIVNNSTRFELSEDCTNVRSCHGHSIEVRMETEYIPTDDLLHGTSVVAFEAIRSSGFILPMRRAYVHLTEDPDKALSVGKRHGHPVILIIDARRMYEDGYRFYISNDGAILTDKVPLEYIKSS